MCIHIPVFMPSINPPSGPILVSPRIIRGRKRGLWLNWYLQFCGTLLWDNFFLITRRQFVMRKQSLFFLRSQDNLEKGVWPPLKKKFPVNFRFRPEDNASIQSLKETVLPETWKFILFERINNNVIHIGTVVIVKRVIFRIIQVIEGPSGLLGLFFSPNKRLS